MGCLYQWTNGSLSGLEISHAHGTDNSTWACPQNFKDAQLQETSERVIYSKVQGLPSSCRQNRQRVHLFIRQGVWAYSLPQTLLKIRHWQDLFKEIRQHRFGGLNFQHSKTEPIPSIDKVVPWLNRAKSTITVIIYREMDIYRICRYFIFKYMLMLIIWRNLICSLESVSYNHYVCVFYVQMRAQSRQFLLDLNI